MPKEEMRLVNALKASKYLNSIACVEIDKMPTIDAELVVHAHWIDKTTWFASIGKCNFECSNCGYTIDHKPGRADGKGGKYCDECGAKMDEEMETAPFLPESHRNYMLKDFERKK